MKGFLYGTSAFGKASAGLNEEVKRNEANETIRCFCVWR
jgi:hypothetical protein